jgi:site-specific DNA-methyltransferase (adenine-specific)
MELFNSDCFDILPEILDNSVNLFLLDLPYNQTACKWDKDIIDLDKMWKEIKRIMKPNAIIIFFCTARFGYRLIHSNTKWFRYDLIWKKSRKVGFLSANKMPLRQHENIYVFKDEQGIYNPQKTPREKDYKHSGKRSSNEHYGGSVECKKEYKKEDGMYPTSVIDHENIYVFKDKQGTYNPQKTKGKPYNKTNTGNNNKDSCAYGEVDRSSHLKGEGNRAINKGDRHPTSIIENTVLEFNNPHNTIHRTQKSVELCEWLIKTYSNENDLVCDFCMGSGTVGVACKNTKRQFIGIEKDDKIFELAYDRINNL